MANAPLKAREDGEKSARHHVSMIWILKKFSDWGLKVFRRGTIIKVNG